MFEFLVDPEFLIFQPRYNPTWHCIVGRNFGSYVTHETRCVYFQPFSEIWIWSSGTSSTSTLGKWQCSFSRVAEWWKHVLRWAVDSLTCCDTMLKYLKCPQFVLFKFRETDHWYPIKWWKRLQISIYFLGCRRTGTNSSLTVSIQLCVVCLVTRLWSLIGKSVGHTVVGAFGSKWHL